MKFLIPSSITPIYQTIIDNLSSAITDQEHQVDLFPLKYKYDLQTLIIELEELDYDFIIIPNFSNLFTLLIKEREQYLFELLSIPIIFIHHDNVFHGIRDLFEIAVRLNAFKSLTETSFHFCLEHDDCHELKSIGIKNVFPINHASEFLYFQPRVHNFKYNVSFVGHVLPQDDNIFKDDFGEKYLKSEYWNRVCNPGVTRSENIDDFYDYANSKLQTTLKISDKEKYVLYKYFFINLLHSSSQFFRGSILKEIITPDFHIFGGDPSYLNGNNLERQIQGSNFIYHKPVNREESANIFLSSKINFNITSLQFKTAAINRIIDIGILGSFFLTDEKESLKSLTSEWEAVTYSNTIELNEKIDTFLTKDTLRTELSKHIQDEFKHNCTYTQIANYILDTISLKHL